MEDGRLRPAMIAGGNKWNVTGKRLSEGTVTGKSQLYRRDNYVAI